MSAEFLAVLKDIADANNEARAEEDRRGLVEFFADPDSPDHQRERLPGEMWRALR